MRYFSWFFGLAVGAVGLAACQSSKPLVPGVFSPASAEVTKIVTATLAKELDRADLTIFPPDLTDQTRLSIQPPRPAPLETSSPALPMQIDILTDGTHCFLKDVSSGALYQVSERTCRRADL